MWGHAQRISETQHFRIRDHPAPRPEKFVILDSGIADCLIYICGRPEEVEPDVAGTVGVRGFGCGRAGAGETGVWLAAGDGGGIDAVIGGCAWSQSRCFRRSCTSALALRSSWPSSWSRLASWPGRRAITIRSAILWRVSASFCCSTSVEFILNLWCFLQGDPISLSPDPIGDAARNFGCGSASKRFMFRREILGYPHVLSDNRFSARHRQQPVIDMPDIIADRRSQPANGLVDLRQPLLELVEHTGEIAARRSAFHHVALEPTSELLMRPCRDRLVFTYAKPIPHRSGIGLQIIRGQFVAGIAHQLFEPRMPGFMDEGRGVRLPHQSDCRLPIA